ncbi:ATP-binding protein [Gemmatimonas sp.]|uniref:ATP-binding protein n=1 Tax=Gemmatimonas sp. TaxID=1962908 RepID=UPI00398354CA
MLTVPSLLGWLFGIPWLVQPFETFAPARLGGTVMIVTGAGGMLAKLAGRRPLSRRLAVLCGLAASLALILAWQNAPLPLEAFARARVGDSSPLRDIPISAALLYLLYSTALYLLASESPSERRRAITGTLSALLVASSGVLLLAQLAGMLGSDGAAAAARAPLHSLLASLLLGTALLQRTTAHEARTKAPPRWAPVLAGASTMLLVLVLWQALVARELSQTRARAAIAADALDRAVQRQLLAVDRALGRTAAFLSGAGLIDDAAWTTVFPRLVNETPGLAGMVWLDSAGTVLRAIPSAPLSPIVQRQLLDFVSRRYHADRASVKPTASLTSIVPYVLALHDAPWGMALMYPIDSPPSVAAYGRTVVVGFVDEAALIGEFTSDVRGGFSVAVSRGDSIISGRVASTSPEYTAPLKLGARALTMSVSQAPGTSRSTLPELVLLLGLSVAVLLSVTMWQQREMLAQASSEGIQRMQRAIERATDGVWELDVLRGAMHRSPALLRYLGIEPWVLEGGFAAWSALIHPDDRAAYARALDAHVRGHAEAFECEYRLRAGDGSWHALVDRGRVVERTADGSPARLLGISADVTERALADASRDESDRRFRAMFDTANQVQLLLDYDGSILEANRAAGELAGTTADALPGVRFWLSPWWADDALTGERVQDRFVKARAGDTNRFEVEIGRPGDRVVTIDFSLKPIRDHEEKVVQVLVEGRDLTVRKRAEESLREIGALTTMGQLAASVAHEINNPLAGIQNAFLLIRGAIPTDHPHYRFVGAIEREIARIAAVTRQLYETYRPDQSMIAQSSVILAVTDAVSFLEQVNRVRQVNIVTDLSRAPSLVPVPDALLRQTMYNLVQNAFDASPASGTITVTAMVEQDECVLRVTDEGPGVPDALRQRIFDPFFSTKDRTVKTGGMGIGLSLVRQSVHAVGGSIVVHDRPQGGTEFEVRLPMTPLDTGVLR